MDYGQPTLALSHLIEIHYKYKLTHCWGEVVEVRKHL